MSAYNGANDDGNHGSAALARSAGRPTECDKVKDRIIHWIVTGGVFLTVAIAAWVVFRFMAAEDLLW